MLIVESSYRTASTPITLRCLERNGLAVYQLTIRRTGQVVDLTDEEFILLSERVSFERGTDYVSQSYLGR